MHYRRKIMNLLNIKEEELELLINSLSVNPNISEWDKEPLVTWMRLQLKEQRAGGPWKARIREAGYSI